MNIEEFPILKKENIHFLIYCNKQINVFIKSEGENKITLQKYQIFTILIKTCLRLDISYINSSSPSI